MIPRPRNSAVLVYGHTFQYTNWNPWHQWPNSTMARLCIRYSGATCPMACWWICMPAARSSNKRRPAPSRPAFWREWSPQESPGRRNQARLRFGQDQGV